MKKRVPFGEKKLVELSVQFGSMTGEGFVVLADDAFGLGLFGGMKYMKPTESSDPLGGGELRRIGRNVAEVDGCRAVTVEE